MNSESSGARKTGASESSPDATDTGVLRRDEGIFPVVGLGGSAGGIAALQEFFAAMPVNSGMAFVVILHLSPHHDSNRLIHVYPFHTCRIDRENLHINEQTLISSCKNEK